MKYTESFPIDFKPGARSEAVVIDPGVRFTVLTPCLLRLEYSPTEAFENRPSQVFWYRELPVPDFQVQRQGGAIQIDTDCLLLEYQPNEAGFAPHTLSIKLKESRVVWRFGDSDPDNLKGTARTLDEAHGAIELEPGLVSRSGWVVVDDVHRLVFDDKGWLMPRDVPPGDQDLYFFGYGHDYAGCLRDFCKVAGPVPILPRWVLGNWWSRYWAYTADELLALMHEFKDNDTPLSVCIVDMDWHITDTGNRSSGWTGYTWNRDLFPDPQAFIQALHQSGLKTALNLHPALGVFPHEQQHRDMVERLGLDPTTEDPVPFDIADPKFTRAYFELLHHPYEADGIDFWWVDWQQGTESGLSGLDPLWWLNHLHYYDLGRGGQKRSFIFSRWGGLGNHRYPIGFSGDTVVSWESLAFQPYFTATAANVAYGWWSHDMGGHMGGVEDAELFVRWVQFGVFSPIFRLHCTKNAFHERRPWGYDAETFQVTRYAMQLRHALIPYLYTMSWRNHSKSIPLVRPMYHDHAEHEQAYHCPDQYTFGSELIAAPFITPADPETRMSRQVVWLPAGQWFHFFTALSYPGDGWHAIYGGPADVPLFAQAGAIVPLAPKCGWGAGDTPDALELHVFPGADNQFELYEDDGVTTHSLVPFSLMWQSRELRFEIGAASGDTRHLPEQRAYTLFFREIVPGSLAATINGQALDCAFAYDKEDAVLTVGPVLLAPDDDLTITITTEADTLFAERDRRMWQCRELLRACRLNTRLKSSLDRRLAEILDDPSILGDFELDLDSSVARALIEIITGAGVHRTIEPEDGRARVVLWNNEGTPHLTYRFMGVPVLGRLAVRQKGPLPGFAALVQRDEHLDLCTSEGTSTRGESSDVKGAADVQTQFRKGRWKLSVNYLNMFTLQLGRSE